MKEDITYFVRNRWPFELEMAGTSYCDGSYRIHRDNSHVTVIEYVEKGTGTIEINHQIYHPKAGDVYILPRGSCHTYYSDAFSPWTKHFMNIKGPMASKLLELYNLNAAIVIHCPEAAPLFKKALEACKMIESDIVYANCEMIYHEILILLNHHYNFPDNVEMETLRKYMDNHFSEHITIEDLCKIVNRSQDYIIKEFKRSYKKTPHAYLTQKRMEAAEIMLINTSLSIQQISNNCGFCDQHYFCNIFKQYFGMPPSRKKKRG